MKLENNWRQNSLEDLENDYWCEPGWNSHVDVRCHELRKKRIGDFTTEDLRIMIGQQIGLFYLIPLAIETLTIDIFAEGDYYPGDLLKMVLEVDAEFWKINKELWVEIDTLIKNSTVEIAEKKISVEKFRNSEW